MEREKDVSNFFFSKREKKLLSYLSVVGKFVTTNPEDDEEYMAAKLDFVKEPRSGKEKVSESDRLEDFSAYLVRSNKRKPLNEIWEHVHQTLSKAPAVERTISFPPFRAGKHTEFPSTMFPSLLRPQNTDFPVFAQGGGKDSLDIKLFQHTLICVDENGSLGGGMTPVDDGGDRFISYLNFNSPFYFIIAGNKVSTPLFISYVEDGMTDVNDKCS
ncbi:hypothetical protein HMI54_007372 [Coelomomyces lativittatus]|nr:hypothetical protein HMI54_007372 [Coelomomyces lativittatus]